VSDFRSVVAHRFLVHAERLRDRAVRDLGLQILDAARALLALSATR